MLLGAVQRYEKVGQSESESDWSRDDKKGEYSQDEGETDVELSQVAILNTPALRTAFQSGSSCCTTIR